MSGLTALRVGVGRCTPILTSFELPLRVPGQAGEAHALELPKSGSTYPPCSEVFSSRDFYVRSLGMAFLSCRVTLEHRQFLRLVPKHLIRACNLTQASPTTTSSVDIIPTLGPCFTWPSRAFFPHQVRDYNSMYVSSLPLCPHPDMFIHLHLNQGRTQNSVRPQAPAPSQTLTCSWYVLALMRRYLA
ncbi:hypothetical protein FKP32DRAFT_1091084 [Trametes sanguinea]|nr:hypothetical protein FKP32DRAFT_1091084 [Trametes sanguinea]